MACLPTAARPPVIECTRPTLMTSCAQALWGAPSSTAIAIALTRHDLSIGVLPWFFLSVFFLGRIFATRGQFGGAPARPKPERCAPQDRTDAVDFQRLLAGADQARSRARRAIHSRIKPCP